MNRPQANAVRSFFVRRCPPIALFPPTRYAFAWILAVALLLGQLSHFSAPSEVSQAYIGPGAGIAVVGGAATILLAIATAIFVILVYPFRLIWRLVVGRKRYGKAKVKRAIVIGLDGLEPSLAEQFMGEGLLPNLAKLREAGSYTRLGTTWPPLSPVAWSSFTTGSNPGKHNIFDFIDRTPHYAPTMSSVRIRSTKPRKLLGIIPVGGGQEITGLRKSKPFWTVLGERGVFSAVIRVPITYPPDKFRGVQLSAMCAPDLRGTLGLFTFYAEHGDAEDMADGGEGGEKLIFAREGEQVSSYLRGPTNPKDPSKGELRVPFTVRPGGKGADAVLTIGKETVPLKLGVFTDWVSVSFPLGGSGSLAGICRFYLKRFDKTCELYCSPIMIDPARPVAPISHPAVYSSYLTARQGPFNTLGLAEDTGALDRQVLDEEAFLDHVYSIHAERERMLFDSLDKVRQGVVTCVFDGPDRIQHMFWRFHDPRHPALDDAFREKHKQVIRDMYVRMDKLVGRVMARAGRKAAVFVMSDHGFKSFRRCVDLNAWLRDNGYLFLKDGKRTSESSWLKDIDWSRTRAFALGLAGIFVNQKGRESQGIVAAGMETNSLIAELCEKLSGLVDPQTGEAGVREAVPRFKVYKGPYAENAPDVVVGYNDGYRVSWDSATGKCAERIFYDNLKAWSGDHCVHPEIVPGVLFSNLALPKRDPAIIDMAPTLLELFGVPTPAYMDGKSLLSGPAPGPRPGAGAQQPEPAMATT